MGAIASCEISDEDRFIETIGMAQPAREAVTKLLRGHELDTALNGDSARHEMRRKGPFGLRLGGEQDERETRVRPTDIPQINDRRLAAVNVQHQSRRRPPPAGKLLSYSDGLKHFKASRLHG